ncbi:MAG: 5-formyltetrahydrofolate cyclo-ligase [Alphaproteobacteria bacterium]|nr:5-formyltetrahydrofolate cyclo-ligase [Alphaproteobacteria bacterium]
MEETGYDLRDQKNALREQAREKRAGLHAANPYAGEQFRDVFLTHIRPPKGTVVSSYAPHGTELPTSPLNLALHNMGYTLCLPVVLSRGHALAFRKYEPAMKLDKGLLSVLEPPATSPIVLPEMILVPLLAFNRQGFRLGYGGGYYDRTLTLLRRERKVLAVGVAYAGQEYADVPVGYTDAPLDWVVTELFALPLSKK